MKTASFLYKCRLCSKIEKNPHTGEPNALLYLLAAIDDKIKAPSMIGTPPKILSIHSCKAGNTGVSDLIGYEITG